MKRKTKYALVLSGGGFNGAFQLGAINYINDNWQVLTGLAGKMKFDLIAGVSVGAINGAMLASNKLGQLNELWLNKIAKNGVSEIYTSDFIDTHHKGDHLKMRFDIEGIRNKMFPEFKIELGLLKKLGLIFSKKKRRQVLVQIFKALSSELKSGFSKFRALADNKPLRLKLQKYLNKDKIIETEFLCGFVSLNDGLYKSVLHSDFQSNKDFINGVISSACIPMVYEPVEKVVYHKDDEMVCSQNNIDGGVNNVSPLGDVVERINADSDYEYKIIIINCHNGVNVNEDYTNKNIAQIAFRSLYEIAFTEIFNNDVKHFLKINDLVKQANAWYNQSQPILFDSNGDQIKAFDAVVIQPEKDIDLGNGLVANEKLINLRLNHGEMMAKRSLGLE